jgi:membrane carboxypeptidase/penicillin-binding protein
MKAIFLCMGVIAFLCATGLLWLYYDSRNLPDMGYLAKFSPSTVSGAYDPCWKHESVAIPYNSIGSNLRKALNAAEVREDDPSVLMSTYWSFTDRALHRATLSVQISRTLFCAPAKMSERSLAELRAGAQLERRFSRRELFTIYANRAYFGEDLNGVEAGASRFFHKQPDELTVGEAALLAGVIKSPSLYFPVKHPDRALIRRNEVIDAMIASGTIKITEGAIANESSLGLAADPNIKN